MGVEDRLDVYGEHEAGLQQWMQRFGPLAHQVGASQSLAEVCKAAMAVAQECMAAQTAAASAKVIKIVSAGIALALLVITTPVLHPFHPPSPPSPPPLPFFLSFH